MIHPYKQRKIDGKKINGSKKNPQPTSGLIQSPSPAPTESGGGCLAGWQSPKASDCKSPGKSRDVHLKHQAEMTQPNTDMKLNPFFSLFLMNFPPIWGLIGIKASLKR